LKPLATDPRRLRALLPVALALVGMVLLLNLISFAFGQAPLATLHRAFEGTWGTAYGVGQVLFKATPLVFTGLCFELALRAGLFNIGAEGQLALASLVGAWVAAKLPGGLPAIVALPLVLAVAAIVGAGVAAIPAAMRARLGVHEIITAIMMNRIVDAVLPWALASAIGSSSLRTADIAHGAALPRLDRVFPSLTGSAVSFAFPLAVVAAFVVMALLERTRAGREMRWIGLNAEACRAEGVNVKSRMVLAMLLSGAIAGLGMSGTALGYKGYYELGLGAGAGFSGIAVAMLGRGNPAGIVAAAVLLGTLEQAGLAVNATVPKEAMSVLEAAMIVIVAAASRLPSQGGGRPSAEPAEAETTKTEGRAEGVS
jgi:simple sugar transport system permease protein